MPYQTIPRDLRADVPFRLTTLRNIADILMNAAWVAVCAASPEFIWRGARIMRADVSLSELWAAIPLGFVLAFFVEPVFERARHGLTGYTPRQTPGRGPAFHALIGVVFAFCAICVHHAMTAVILAHGVTQSGHADGQTPAIALTAGWALVPFMILLAWRSIHRPVLCVALTLLSAASPLFAGLIFGWSRADILDTTVPCIAILLLNLHRLRNGAPWQEGLRSVAQVGGTWLVSALFFDLLADATGHKHLSIYSPSGFWMDVRFYVGWGVGLWLALPHVLTSAPVVIDARSVRRTDVSE